MSAGREFKDRTGDTETRTILADDIEYFEGLKKWNWTLPELSYLSELTNYQLEKIEVEAPQFMESIDEFRDFIDSLEKEYTVELNSIFKFRRYLFSLVLPD